MNNDIAEFYFKLNRGYTDFSILENILRTSKNFIKKKGNCPNVIETLRTLFLLIAHCRDFYGIGKGERNLSYKMIVVWFSFFPELAIAALHNMSGSWNDIKYFCLFNSGSSTSVLNEQIIAIANKQLRTDLELESVSNVSKWIPRERSHKELYDAFVIDWYKPFIGSFQMDSLRKKYRQIIARVSKKPKDNKYKSHFSFIGEYVKLALRNECVHEINCKWIRMAASFSKCYESIAIVDIDISISKENLYHALGFACLIAQKSGSMRVLLISSEPIWVDLSKCCGFSDMVSLLWEYCEYRTRSQFPRALDLIYDSLSGIVLESSFKLFIFSEGFDFDWPSFFNKLGGKIAIIFWNIGTKVSIPNDFYIEDHKELFLMSGYMPGLLRPFCTPYVLMFQGSCGFLREQVLNYSLMNSSFDSVMSLSTSSLDGDNISDRNAVYSPIGTDLNSSSISDFFGFD